MEALKNISPSFSCGKTFGGHGTEAHVRLCGVAREAGQEDMFFIRAEIKQCWISPSLDQENTFLTHGLCATLSCDLVGDCIPIPGSVWRGMSSRVSPTSWLFPVTVVWESDNLTVTNPATQSGRRFRLCPWHHCVLITLWNWRQELKWIIHSLKMPEAILCGMMGVGSWLAGGHICQDSNGQGCRTCTVIPIHPVCLHFTALSATKIKGT